MDILQLYTDFSIDHRTEGHKHCRPGWVNVECPWCEGNPGYHLGYNLLQGIMVCWRCGWHPVNSTLALLLHMKEPEVRTIVKQYGGITYTTHLPEPEVRIRTKVHRLPSGIEPLQTNHRRYLERRKFDPDRLERDWMLLGTTPVSMLDGIDYRHRILIPFLWDARQVSFDSRDITGKHPMKYMACPADRELIPHKSILYGKQEKWGTTGICVEGPTDVWRFGTDSFATSGIKYTQKQVGAMAKIFQRIFVCFDGNEPQALNQANTLIADLRFRNVETKRIDIVGDPGDMDQSEADYLVKQLIGNQQVKK